ncbi:MAG: hypothetical protein COW65_16700 [Cytophagales bacterium CG18_big_fil_WC_8_21_14_2_50_42_9]|nr:MAG: hypothetical protein COW65_16700 [Cytophagales bacterium CG18_big_fil_WC_8_21_14_2_50_42_9]
MEHKYNQLSIEQYSNNLAKLLCDRYFVSNQTISGQQLVSFSPVKQVNLFIIQELLRRWNQEMANLRSPYFDFENEEVKEALVQFMNILSRKISIKRPHFEPLLVKAITDTFLWVLDPAKIFDEKFLQGQDEISGVKLQTHLKYIQINREYVRQFLEGLALGNLPHGNVLNQFRTYLLRNTSDPNALNNLIGEFNALLPLQRSDIENTPVMPAAPDKEAVPPAPAFFSERERAAPAPEIIFPKAPEPTYVPPVNTPTPPAILPHPQSVREPVMPEPKLNERYRVEQAPSLNDRLAKPAATNLAESQMGAKIESLKESISINQRFGFINELFNGENMEYHTAIKTLDEFQDAESARNYVTQDLASRYNWSKKEEHVNKLLRLIERKFA